MADRAVAPAEARQDHRPAPARARRLALSPRWWFAAAAFGLLTLTWLVTTPPWGSPDEPSALALGLSAAHAHPPGRAPDYRYPASTFIEQWYRQLTRVVDVPSRQMPQALIPCYAFVVDRDAACLAEEPVAPFGLPAAELAARDPGADGSVDIRLLIARLGVEGTASDARTVPVSYVGTYQPFVYAAAALVALPGSTPEQSLYLGRLGIAISSLTLVAIGLRLLSRSAGAVRWAAAATALTPMAIFSSATFSSSGPEIAAAFCHLVALIEWRSRGGLDRSTRIALLASAIVLALARSTGPLWLVLFDATAVVAIGVRRAIGQLRAVRRWAVAYASIVAVAVAASVGWQLLVQPRPPQDRSRLAGYIADSFHALPGQLRQQVGVFGWLDTRLPGGAYLLWFLATGGMVVAALLAASWRGRVLVLAIGAASIVAMMGVAVTIAYPVQSGSQGRWTLPLVMALPLVAGAMLEESRWRARCAAGLAIASGVVVATVHVVALWSAARRNAVGANGAAWFFGSSRWRPPLGWAPWVVTTVLGGVLLVWVIASSAAGRRDEAGS